MESLYIWPSVPILSMLALVVLSMAFMFLAREPLHKALHSLSDGVSGGLRKLSKQADQMAATIKERDRKILLESGVATAARKVHEEFGRVETSYSKHLLDYPGLQRRLDDQISKLEADYNECGQVTPTAPGWDDAVAAIAKVQGTSGDRVVEKVLGEIHKSAVDGEKRALSELRNTTSQRHKILAGMVPIWKGVSKLLEEMSGRVEHVLETTERIDQYMAEFQKTNRGDQESIDTLVARANKLFIFSVIIITIAGFGAFVNFQLIALPVSELVPASTRVLGIPVSDFSAMIIICLEVVCGIFLMESLGITNIIPQIGNMTRGRRRLVMYVSLVFLFLFACAESSLGILREVLAETRTAVTQTLAGGNANVATGTSQFTTIGQATLGFLLPWVIAMVAMPLEVLIESSQHIVSRLMALLVTLFAQLSRLLGYLVEYSIQILIHLYDAWIIVPLQIKNLLSHQGDAHHRAHKA
jgi:hypothetical protein